MSNYTLLCSANCLHRTGEGYYGICEHPTESGKLAGYGGVTRNYVSGCNFQEEKTIINRCPECGSLPTIGADANSGKPMIACMNATCTNMTHFIDESVGVAMAKWNMWAYDKIKEVMNRDGIRVNMDNAGTP